LGTYPEVKEQEHQVKNFFRRLSLPQIVAILAVALVLGSGTAYAAKQVTSKTIKNNTIKSVDVKDGALTGTDVADGSVTSADILDGTLTTADVATDTLSAADLAANSVGTSEIIDSTITTTDVAADTLTSADLATSSVDSAEIATNGVQASEIADDSIDGGEIVDFQLTNQDIGVLFAQVNGAGVLNNSSGGVTTLKLAGLGQYEVDFGRNITACAFFGTVGPAGGGSASGSVNVADRGGNDEAVFVNTDNSAGVNADLPFHLLVVC
jgi:hypothetical protein